MFLATVAAPLYNNDLPPEKYQGNAPASVLIIVDNPNSNTSCGVAKPGWFFQGCEETTEKGVPVITTANPCSYPEVKDPDSYAHLMCHEFGHANGWNSTHDN